MTDVGNGGGRGGDSGKGHIVKRWEGQAVLSSILVKKFGESGFPFKVRTIVRLLFESKCPRKLVADYQNVDPNILSVQKYHSWQYF